MKVILDYDPDTGEILRWRPKGVKDLNPDAPELTVDVSGRDEIRGKVVDTSSDPPELVDAPDREWNVEPLLEGRGGDLIRSHFRDCGIKALEAHQAMKDDPDVAQSTTDFAASMVCLHYLNYVALTGKRVEEIEEAYFNV